VHIRNNITEVIDVTMSMVYPRSRFYTFDTIIMSKNIAIISKYRPTLSRTLLLTRLGLRRFGTLTSFYTTVNDIDCRLL
jgi:threonine/homoserine efflux transporter RhtA